jgi:ER lumen protein retaining receptor
MNIFRLAGDMSHVASIIVLLLRLKVVKNAAGVSLRTHELFLMGEMKGGKGDRGVGIVGT